MRFDLNPAAAFRATDRLSLGAGVSRQRLDAELTQMVNGAFFGPPDFGFRVRGHSLAWGYNFGVQYEASAQLTVGAAYRSAVSHEIEGDYAFEAGTPPPLVAAAGLPAANGAARVKLKLPATYTFAAAWKAGDRWELLADATRTGWSSVKEQRVEFPGGGADQVTPFNWRSVWRLSVGANYRVNDRWTLRGGVALDRSPIPDETRSPRLPGEDAVILALGARFALSPAVILNAGYNYVHARDARVNYNGGNAVANGMLTGTYDRQHIHIIGIYVTAAF